jgi:FixJ family two-component response regulator
MLNKLENNSEKLLILIIEDNKGDYVLIEDNLLEKFSNIELIHHLNFNDAAQYLQQSTDKPSVILLDLNLPDLEGIELVKAVVELSFQIPIIVLTGYSDLIMAESTIQLGVSDYLVKDELNPILLHKSIIFAISRSNYIKHIEIQNNNLNQIAWTQSHILRAPLSRILGIVHLLQEHEIDSEELSFLLEQIKISSNEMDTVVRKIVENTKTVD